MKIRKILIVFAIAALMLTLFAVAAYADDTNSVYEYYYTQLSHDEKLAYDVMRGNVEMATSNDTFSVDGFTGVKTVFSLVEMNIEDVDPFLNNGTSEFAEQAHKGMQCILNASTAFLFDHPEYYWVNGNIRASVSGGTDSYSYDPSNGQIVSGNAYLYFFVEFSEPGANHVTKLAQLKSAVSAIDAKSGSDYDKVKKIHDYLCDKIQYNYAMASGNGVGNAYNAMIDQSTVCQGYAMAFKMACDTFGVNCICVPGNAVNPNNSKGEPHMWNFVEINGKWYGLDATWDDQSAIMRDFFLVGGDTVPTHFDELAFSTSHHVDFDTANFTAPELNDYSCVTLSTAAVSVSGKSYALTIDTNISNGEAMGVDIANVSIVVDGVEAARNNSQFVSEPIRLDKALNDITIELYVGDVLCDSVTFSFEAYQNSVGDQISKDILQLVSAIDVYNGGVGVTVTGATQIDELETRTSTKVVVKSSVDDYIKSASLRIDENINVIFKSVCKDATKAVISANGIDDDVKMRIPLKRNSLSALAVRLSAPSGKVTN